jgi:hypothetical protein
MRTIRKTQTNGYSPGAMMWEMGTGMKRIGNGAFAECSIPIVFEGHHFIIEQGRGADLVSVFFMNHETPVFEILRNEPRESSALDMRKSSAAVITAGLKNSEGYLYKVRPGPQETSVWATIRGEEIEIHITGTLIIVGPNIFPNIGLSRFEMGVTLSADGSIALGQPVPDRTRHLFRI